MQRDEGLRVRCPACGAFVARVTSTECEVEVNCSQSRCGVTMIISRTGKTDVTVKVAEKPKRA